MIGPWDLFTYILKGYITDTKVMVWFSDASEMILEIWVNRIAAT